jgi:hypothetical protein
MMTLITSAGRVAAVQDAAIAWGGHSDHSRFRTAEMTAVAAAISAAKAVLNAWAQERVDSLRAHVAEYGVVPGPEWAPVPGAGIGHWEVQETWGTTMVRRVTQSGQVEEPRRLERTDDDVRAVVRRSFLPGAVARVVEGLQDFATRP